MPPKPDELRLMLKLVTPLDEGGFDTWEKQMLLAAFTGSWGTSILSTAPIDPSAAPPEEGNAADRAIAAHNRKVAYTLIVATVGATSDLLEDVALGDANAAYKAVHAHYVRRTTSGFQTAMITFQTSKMSDENVNLVQFKALITRRSKRLIDLGGTAGDQEKTTVLMNGLLPEFELILITLRTKPLASLTYNDAYTTLHDYAVSKGIDDLRRTSSVTQAKSFLVTSSPSQPLQPPPARPPGSTGQECNSYAQHKNCAFGSDCIHLHAGQKPTGAPDREKIATIKANALRGRRNGGGGGGSWRRNIEGSQCHSGGHPICTCCGSKYHKVDACPDKHRGNHGASHSNYHQISDIELNDNEEEKYCFNMEAEDDSSDPDDPPPLDSASDSDDDSGYDTCEEDNAMPALVSSDDDEDFSPVSPDEDDGEDDEDFTLDFSPITRAITKTFSPNGTSNHRDSEPTAKPLRQARPPSTFHKAPPTTSTTHT